MTKDEFIEKVSALPGVGKKTAERLYDAGFTTLEKLKKAKADDLTKVEGVGKKTADAILAGLKDLEAPAAKEEIEVVEPGAVRGPAATEVVEPEAVYRPKMKAQLDEETRRLLAVRKDKKSREPYFMRYHHWRERGIDGDSWRFPHGMLNKQRRGFQYRAPKVRVGYGKPAATRGLHSSGFEEVLVQNVAELDRIEDPGRQAARIGGTVGLKKRKEILAAATERKIRVLNPGKVSR